MNLDNANAFFQTYLNNYKQQMPPPATYQQSQQQEQILLPNRNSRVDITITTNKYTLDDFHIDSNGDDASSLNGIGSIDTVPTNTDADKQSTSSSSNGSNTNVISNSNVSRVNNNNDITTDLMSPFNEQEEWAKISEIMESFGSSLVSFLILFIKTLLITSSFRMATRRTKRTDHQRNFLKHLSKSS